ncbi:MAG: hypothetical protein HRU28_06950 [Rhizobiales bacterium]|nr:hypothetical protein [Hyphomicrobiales bacterium]
MATHIFRGKNKEEAYNSLYAMAGKDVFIIREFTDQSDLYCIEAAPKVSNTSVKENAIPQNVSVETHDVLSPAAIEDKPEITRDNNVERLTISQLLSHLRFAGFHELTLRQFVYWVKQQNDTDPSINRNQPKDIALHKFAEYLSIQKVISPIKASPNNPILLVGPPGSGKTVTTARLCAKALMSGEVVDFVTLDCVRTGAVEQSKALTRFLEVKLTEIENIAQFKQWMDGYHKNLNHNTTFIDSLSTNIYDMNDMRWLLDYMEAAEQNGITIEPVLVINASTDATTIGDYATTFKSMGVSRAILTCWDIASKPAATFSAIIDADIKISMICDSPYLTSGLEELTALTLAQKLAEKKGMPAWLEQIGKLK